jgi:hypothetical protein
MITTLIMTCFFSWVHFLIDTDSAEKALLSTQRVRKSVDILKDHRTEQVYQM